MEQKVSKDQEGQPVQRVLKEKQEMLVLLGKLVLLVREGLLDQEEQLGLSELKGRLVLED